MGLAIQGATKRKYQTGRPSNPVAVGLRLSRFLIKFVMNYNALDYKHQMETCNGLVKDVIHVFCLCVTGILSSGSAALLIVTFKFTNN